MDINIDYQDYKSIYRHKGRIVGFNSEVVRLVDVEEQIAQRWGDDLTKAKAVLINWTTSPQANSKRGLSIQNTMKKIHELVDDKTDCIMGDDIDNSLKPGECRYHIVLTGILDKIT
jgi:cell division GTPase FtsZ